MLDSEHAQSLLPQPPKSLSVNTFVLFDTALQCPVKVTWGNGLSIFFLTGLDPDTKTLHNLIENNVIII